MQQLIDKNQDFKSEITEIKAYILEAKLNQSQLVGMDKPFKGFIQQNISNIITPNANKDLEAQVQGYNRELQKA